MVHRIQRKLIANGLPMLLLLSACQPIRPATISTTDTCTDADKIALLQLTFDPLVGLLLSGCQPPLKA